MSSSYSIRGIELASLQGLFDRPSSSTRNRNFLASCARDSASCIGHSSNATPSKGVLSPSGAGRNSLPAPEVASFPDGTFENYHQLGVSLWLVPTSTSSPTTERKQGSVSGSHTKSTSTSDSSRISGTDTVMSSSTATTGSGPILERIDFYNPPPPPTPSSSCSTAPSGPNRLGRSKRPQKTYSSAPPLILHFSTDSIPIPDRPKPPKPDVPGVQLRSVKTDSASSDNDDTNSAPSLTRLKKFVIDTETTATELVQNLGEPSRKGGDEGGWVGPWLEWGNVELLLKNENEGWEDDVEIDVQAREGNVSGAKRHVRESGGGAQDTSTVKTVRIGLMVELAPPRPGAKPKPRPKAPADGKEEKAKGLGVWDQVGDWTWGVIKVFKASDIAE